LPEVGLSGLGESLFSPCRETGIALRDCLNRDFADGLEYVLQACTGQIEFPARPSEALLSRIRGGARETPFLYALYFELLEAIEQDRLNDAQALIARMVALKPSEAGILLTSLRGDEFPWDAGTFAGYFAAERDSDTSFTGPPAASLPPRMAQIDAALELIRRSAPDLAAELEEIVTTVVLARAVPLGDESDRIDPWQGASALRAFGSILANDAPDHSVVECTVSLIHEEAHNALFALSPSEGVVANADHERHASPLSRDPRPFEGIFHATFVIARVVYGMETMLNSGHLSGEEQQQAEHAAKTHRPLFFDGLNTLRAHARLTVQGETALNAAEAYMARFAWPVG
jgi:hypothetical protein